MVPPEREVGLGQHRTFRAAGLEADEVGAHPDVHTDGIPARHGIEHHAPGSGRGEDERVDVERIDQEDPVFAGRTLARERGEQGGRGGPGTAVPRHGIGRDTGRIGGVVGGSARRREARKRG